MEALTVAAARRVLRSAWHGWPEAIVLSVASLGPPVMAQAQAPHQEQLPPIDRSAPALTVPWDALSGPADPGGLVPRQVDLSAAESGSASWWSIAGGIQGSCNGCGAVGVTPPGSSNAPLSVRVSLTLARGANQFTLGVVGRHGHRLPLYIAQPLGADRENTVPVSSLMDVTQTRTRWTITASAQRALKESGGGSTLTLMGDVLVPVNRERMSLTNPQGSAAPSGAARVGVGLGF